MLTTSADKLTRRLAEIRGGELKMTNHPNRNRIDDDRLVAYIQAEHQRRHGYDFPNRETEKAWVECSLPKTKKHFDRVAEKCGRAFRPVEVAAILLGTVARFDATGNHVLATHDRTDLSGMWLSEKTQRKSGHVCAVCGARATHRANKGMACAAHYDDLS